ncbi:MAG: T9SS type A sorting domain-containing protein [Candidatus Marinimicrobia bacterium]|nr:T9SS type A sorting domain-containing protein [Candidatus Neomarinimicrobiota bacterium]
MSNQNTDVINTFISDQGITFPVLRDRSSVYYAYQLAGGQSPYPRDFIIDQFGIIQFASTEYDPGAMITIIERLLDSTKVKTEPKQSSAPDRFVLRQNYPNPFNPLTTVEFDLPQAANVSLVVYDLMGREVAVIVSGRRAPGLHTAVWNGRDAKDQELTSGIYIARLLVEPTARAMPKHSQSIKMLLLK